MSGSPGQRAYSEPDFRGAFDEVVLTLGAIVLPLTCRMPWILLAPLICVGVPTGASGVVVSDERAPFVVQFDEAGVSSLRGADDASAAELIAERQTLGHVRVRYRMGQNEWQEFSTEDPANQRRELRDDPTDSTPEFAVIYNSSEWTDFFADLEVTERFRLERDSLYWSVHLRNPTDKPVEINSIYLRLPFNLRAQRRTIEVGGQSYPYWTQPTGDGPFLVMTPVVNCPIFEPTTSERDFTPAEIERLDEVGLYILPVWQGSMASLSRRKVVLAPRFSRNGRITYAFRFCWARELGQVRAMVEEISLQTGIRQESKNE